MEIANNIRDSIYPVYRKLLAENSFDDICTFSFQWGKDFPFTKNTGLLFVGKAVNGWKTNITDVEKLFDIDNHERIFARSDQMEWVNDLSGKRNGYNTRKSAFWRLIKEVAITYYPDEWYSNIAWTNLYKIAPWNGGNPGSRLQNVQRAYCFELLRKEIELLSPKYVIMLTSDWEQPFLNYLNDSEGEEIVASSKKKWDEYETYLIEIKEVRYIISRHPQGKNEWKHKNAIIELIDEN